MVCGLGRQRLHGHPCVMVVLPALCCRRRRRGKLPVMLDVTRHAL